MNRCLCIVGLDTGKVAHKIPTAFCQRKPISPSLTLKKPEIFPDNCQYFKTKNLPAVGLFLQTPKMLPTVFFGKSTMKNNLKLYECF